MRQLSAWAELIERQQLTDDARQLQLMRVAQHADKKGYNKFAKRLGEMGS